MGREMREWLLGGMRRGEVRGTWTWWEARVWAEALKGGEEIAEVGGLAWPPGWEGGLVWVSPLVSCSPQVRDLGATEG